MTAFAAPLYHPRMDTELTRLEARLTGLLNEYKGLHLENRELTTRVATLQAENRRLTEKLVVVTERVEKLLASLPQGDGA